MSDTKTWPSRESGPPCRVCKTTIDRGHRYHEEAGGTVVHYCCKQKEARPAGG